MEHIVLQILIFISVLFIAIGTWFTVVGYEKNDKNEPKKMVDHKKQLKWVGPIVIVMGIVFSFGLLYSYNKKGENYSSSDSMSDSSSDSSSDFGFRFY